MTPIWVLVACLAIACFTSNGEMVRIQPTKEEEEFLKWLVDNGADMSNVVWPAMDPRTGSRGIMAAKDIYGNMSSGKDAAMYYVKVPAKLMITPKRVLRDPEFGRRISWYRRNGNSREVDIERIALFLVFQLNKTDSFFHPFVKVLEEPSMVGDWDQKDQAELQDEPFARGCREAMDGLKRIHSSLPKEHFPPSLFTWERVRWAHGNVGQRSFTIRDDSGKFSSIALVPGADLVNHGDFNGSYGLGDDQKFFSVYPIGNSTVIRKGDECLFSYSPMSNTQSLFSYAFAVRGNRHDEVVMEGKNADTVVTMKDIASWRSREFTSPGRAVYDLCYEGTSSLGRALETCVALMQTRLKEYPTTLQQDIALLAEPNQSVNKRFALYYRIGQKAILEAHLAYCLEGQRAIRSKDVEGGKMSKAEFNAWFIKHAVRPVEQRSALTDWFRLPPGLSRLDIISWIEVEATSRLSQHANHLKTDEL